MDVPSDIRFFAMCLLSAVVGLLVTVYVVPDHSGWAMLAISVATLAVLAFVSGYVTNN